MAGLISLQAILQAAVSAVLAVAEPEFCQGNTLELDQPHPQPGSLRLSRHQTTVSYIYRLPYSHPNVPQPSQVQGFLDRWHDPQIILAEPWQALIRTHTPGQALPSGQILLYLDAAALGGWLWLLTQTKAANPPSITHPLPLTFPQQSALLAERLQLSPLTLLQYTHARCYQLASRGAELVVGANPVGTHELREPPSSLWLSQLATTTDKGHAAFRALIKLVDQMAVPLSSDRPQLEKSLNQSFVAGYQLCEAVDDWLKEVTVEAASTVATTALLHGVEQGLGYLLKVWLQCVAPYSL
jgi:hypothetical protein